MVAMRAEMIDRLVPPKQYEEEATIFAGLFERVKHVLEHFGKPDYVPNASDSDFAVHDDYVGYRQVVVFVLNLAMLRPGVVTALQDLIKEYDGWQIELTVAIDGHEDDWPNMGLYVRPHEVLDALQREYFPTEFRDIEYEGARKGTAYD